MQSIELETLLSPLSDSEPAGPDLQYDADFVALEEALRSEPEQQFGDTIVAAAGPDWQQVKQQAMSILKRSKDLRAAVYLLQALGQLEGIAGVAQGLSVVRGLVERFWESLHPRLEPEDDLDPTERVNIILAICDSDHVLQALRKAPIVTAPGLGSVSLRSMQMAKGQLAPLSEDEEIPKLETLEAALADIDVALLQDVDSHVENALTDMTALEHFMFEKVGVTHAITLDPLSHVMQEIKVLLHEQLDMRGVAVGDNDEQLATMSDTPVSPQSGAGKSMPGEVCNRVDVVTYLDKIITYYKRHEPASPVPLLLRRAKHLVSADFIEILRDLAPDAVTQAEHITGTRQEGDD